MHVTEQQIRWFRLNRSGLGAEPFADPETAAASLAGVQAQILSASALALWNRTASGAATYAEFADRLHERRTIIRLWGQRHTLHLYAAADWPLLHAASAYRQTWWERDAAKQGSEIDLAAYRAAVLRVGEILRERGILGRRDLRGLALPEGLASPWGGVFAELVRAGVAVHAKWDEGEARYAHREHWLPGLAWAPPTLFEANVALARRYFAAYGPSTKNDLAYWRGATLAQAREWTVPLDGELSPVDAAGTPALALTADLPALTAEPPPRAEWPVRMLGRFDPILLGHKDKSWIVPAKFYDRVWRPAGHIEGVVLEHGRAVATWRYDRVGADRLGLTVFPFRVLPLGVRGKLRARAGEVARFFGRRLSDLRVENGR